MSKLRAKPPGDVIKRPKILLFGEAGVGKTLAACQFPRNYLCDGEKGAENEQYVEYLTKAHSALWQSVDADELVAEIRTLLTEDHEFRTVTIDPITTYYADLLDKGERKVGTEFGRHYTEAAKTMRRLINLLMALDMNVIVTCHAKNEYGDAMKKIGVTFDGWKKLDYVFDLVLQLERRGKTRVAIVRKTRIKAFPDGDVFDWSYDEIAKRCGLATVEAKSKPSVLATPEQVEKLNALLGTVQLPEGTADKWLTKANVDVFADMSCEQITKCIAYCDKKIVAATKGTG